MSKVLEALPGDSQRPSVENLRTFAPRPSRAELVAGGEAMRKQCPRSSHAVWSAPHDRPDPLQLVEEGNGGRIPELIPLRHGRHAAIAVHLLSRDGAQHGGGLGRHTHHRLSRAGVR